MPRVDRASRHLLELAYRDVELRLLLLDELAELIESLIGRGAHDGTSGVRRRKR
jgi:hypothetical protein